MFQSLENDPLYIKASCGLMQKYAKQGVWQHAGPLSLLLVLVFSPTKYSHYSQHVIQILERNNKSLV